MELPSAHLKLSNFVIFPDFFRSLLAYYLPNLSQPVNGEKNLSSIEKINKRGYSGRACGSGRTTPGPDGLAPGGPSAPLLAVFHVAA